MPVKALIPVDTEWTPAAISTHRVLPSCQPSFIWAQIFRQLRGLAVVAWAAFIGRATIVVAVTRSWYDQLALALAAMLGARIVVIAHDPLPKQPLSWLVLFGRRMLWKHATVLLTHSETLAAQASVVARRPTKVVAHLPFVEYAAWARKIARDAKSPAKTRFLLLGQMRSDKGLNRLPTIFGLIPRQKRMRMSLAFVGQGNCSEIVAQMTPLVEVTRIPSDHLLSDIEIAQEFATGDVLLAPYLLVSASGTVVLALSRGLSVIAYDAGALADVVAPDGLVRVGDEFGFAERIGAAIERRCGGPVRSLQAWRQESLEAWLEAVRDSSLPTSPVIGLRG
jgi:glycosyltransferase involved in cell wall biosynthesis